MDRWVDKVAVVTGASAGIGLSISVALANAGLRVVGLARRPELIELQKGQVHGKGSIHAKQCDVSRPSDVAAAFQWVEDNFPPIHIIINNAGILINGHITEVGANPLSEEQVLSLIDTNVKGTILCTRHAVAIMRKHSIDGHIININSIAGHYIPQADFFNVYPTTKHAITAFTASLKKELAASNSRIKATSLSPGAVATAMLSSHDGPCDVPALKPEEIADAVLYVLSTPPHVNINELTITSVTEQWL